MSGIDKLIAHANRPWWGPSFPGDYLCHHPDTGQMVGIGLLARSCYATFNLWYFGSNQPRATDMSFVDSAKDIAVWVLAKEFGKLLYQDYPLSEWAMFLPIEQFADLVRRQEYVLPFQGRYYVLGSDLGRQMDSIAQPVRSNDLIPKRKR